VPVYGRIPYTGNTTGNTGNGNRPNGSLRISLHLQEIAFNNANNRGQTLLRRHNAHNAANPDPPEFETVEELRLNEASWGHMGTAGVENYVVGQHTFYLVAAQAPRSFEKAWANGWFHGTGYDKPRAQQVHAAENTPFHCTALHAIQGRWRIYDSAYSQGQVPAPEPRRLSRVWGLTRYWNLFDLLRNRSRAPTSIEMGGGGNGGIVGQCREMACRWIGGEVLHIMGDSSYRIEVVQWEELKRN
jgi:hypothetical protein